ncbi:hypothetical protein SeLEV6574_g07322 [Synchytrium endobioticum]|nr:hypothetical protein SeLEV6574_g07322 [Synchytrium endobioticum]
MSDHNRYHPYINAGSAIRNRVAETPATCDRLENASTITSSAQTSIATPRPILDTTPSRAARTLESLDSILAGFRPRHMAKDTSPSKQSVSSADSGILDINADPEVIDLRKQLKDARREAREQKMKLERRVADMELTQNTQTAQLNEATHRIESLEADRKLLMKKEATAVTELDNALKQASAARDSYEKTISILRRENVEVKESSSFRISEYEATTSDLRFTNQQLAESVATLQRRVSEMEPELNTMVSARQQDRAEFIQLQAELMEARHAVTNATMSSKDDQSIGVLQKQLHDQIVHIQKLEATNKQLQDDNASFRIHRENIERLHEENARLEAQLALMNDLRKRCAELEVEVAKLQGEKLRWTTFLEKQDNTGMDSPYALSKELAKNRMEIVILKDRIGEHGAKMKAKDQYISQLEHQAHEFDSKLRQVEEQYISELRTSKRLERASAFAQRETEVLREQLKSYDMEEANLTLNYDAVKSERIKSLEAMIDEYRQRIIQLESPSDEGTHRSGRSISTSVIEKQSAELALELRQVQKALDDLRTENTLLVKQVDAADDQIQLLETAIGRGEYNRGTTKVLQLRNNPESEEFAIRQSTLQALQGENQSLRDRLADRGDAGLPIASFKALEAEREKLQKDLTKSETKLLRLRTAYQAKATEYREAVFKYLGYKVDLGDEGIRFAPLHGDINEPCIQISNDGTGIRVLKGDQTRAGEVDGMILRWVKEQKSIPGFFASWILDLLQRHRRTT